MNRRGWWLWLVGALGLGQEKILLPTGSGGIPKDGQVWDGEKWVDVPKHKPKNGECPVCGEQHAPFRPWNRRFCADEMVHDIETGKNYSGCDYPRETMVRCSHCSAAFWMDAEVRK